MNQTAVAFWHITIDMIIYYSVCSSSYTASLNYAFNGQLEGVYTQ